MLHGSETWPIRKENEIALQRAEMRMVRWMCDIKLKDRVSNKELRERETRNSGINFHHCPYVNMALMLNISKTQEIRCWTERRSDTKLTMGFQLAP